MEQPVPNSQKKNLFVILAFLIPLVFIAIIVGITYAPSRVSTDYDFVYATCDAFEDYLYRGDCGRYLASRFAVVDGRLAEQEVDEMLDAGGQVQARPFYHDTSVNESREIPLAEAQTLTLNPLITSPDGVSITSDYDRGAQFFPFFDGGSSYGQYLTKGNRRERLNVIQTDGSYRTAENFHFIGWVIE